jgi:hypothetical protein
MHFGGMEAIKDKLAESCTRAESIVGQQVIKDTAPFVPALTGSLTIRTRLDGSKIIYPGPYARFLYYGKVMVDPQTGSTFAPKGGTKVLTNRDLVFSRAMHPQAQSHWFEASKAQNLDKWIRIAEKAVKKFGQS